MPLPENHRRMRARFASPFLPVVAALFFLAGGSAWGGGDTGGKITLSYQDTRSDQSTLHFFNQNYELRFQRRVAPPLQYRIFLRWQDNIGSTKQEGGQEFTSRNQVFNPTFDLLYDLAPFSVGTGIELFRGTSKFDTGEVVRSEQNDWKYYGRFGWRPHDFPSLNVQLDRKTTDAQTSTSASARTTDTELRTTLDYIYNAFTFGYGNRYHLFNDETSAFTRKETENQGRVGYHDAFLRNRVDITATYFISSSTRVEETTNSSVLIVVNPRKIQNALHAIDDTPGDDTDHPLVNAPSLIDGIQDVLPAFPVIGIGTPGGGVFHNIAADLGFAMPADEFRVYVRSSTGNPVPPVGTPILWNVYTSTDGTRWDNVAVGVASVYNFTFGRYEIVFPSTRSRFFKVVNSNVTTVDALVTEIEVVGRDTLFSGRKITTRVLTQSGSLNAIVRPVERVTLNYEGNIGIFRNDADNNPLFTSTNWTQGLSASFEPSRFVNTTFRYQLSKTTPNVGLSQSTDLVSALVNIYFLKTLNTAVTASRSEQMVGSQKSLQVDTLSVHNAAKLYPGWDVSLDGGYTSQESFTDNQSSVQYSLTATSNAQLTRTLTWNANGTLQWTAVNSPEDRRSQDSRVNTEITYIPSQQLRLGGRWGYVNRQEPQAGIRQTGILQGYKADWYPFPRGAIRLSGSYAMDLDPTSNRRIDNYLGTVRWTINPSAYLDFSYASTVQRAVETTRFRTMYTTFSLSL